MSEQPSAPAARAAVARALLRLPDWMRAEIWRLWWDLDRWRRRRLEARGDYRRSAPALHAMDAKLALHLDLSAPGFFVEAGANDGYHQSNTYSLERLHGWRGILVEPVPSLYQAAVRERTAARVFNCALVAPDHAASSVRLVYGGMMTTVAGTRGSLEADRDWVRIAHDAVQEQPEHEFDALARTLSSIIDEAGAPEIDLLSLDVEGFEVQALRGLDLKRHAPRWILVEIREGGSNQAEVEAALGERYVMVDRLSPFDVLYRRVDVPASSVTQAVRAP